MVVNFIENKHFFSLRNIFIAPIHRKTRKRKNEQTLHSPCENDILWQFCFFFLMKNICGRWYIYIYIGYVFEGWEIIIKYPVRKQRKKNLSSWHGDDVWILKHILKNFFYPCFFVLSAPGEKRHNCKQVITQKSIACFSEGRI